MFANVKPLITYDIKVTSWCHDYQWLNIRRLQGHVSAATHPSSCHMTSVMRIVTPSRRILPG